MGKEVSAAVLRTGTACQLARRPVQLQHATVVAPAHGSAGSVPLLAVHPLILSPFRPPRERALDNGTEGTKSEMHDGEAGSRPVGKPGGRHFPAFVAFVWLASAAAALCHD